MPGRPLVVLTSLPMTQITFSLVTAIIGVGNLGMMPPVYHLYWSEVEWRDPSNLHRNTMITGRDVERDSWSTLGRPHFARHNR